MRFRRERGPSKDQLEYLHRKQCGLCHVCGLPADLAVTEGPEAPCRFRVGSSFGRKFRVRPKVMAHRKCAQQRSNEIQNSISVEERRARAGSYPLSASKLAEVLYRHQQGERVPDRALTIPPND